MGGSGSGRRPVPTSKQRVEDALAVRVAALAGQGRLSAGDEAAKVLTWSRADETMASASVTVETDETQRCGLVKLVYDVESDGTVLSVRQSIALTGTRLPPGGIKWWFTCPACGRRRGVLFLPPGDKFFACRRCHQLLYESQTRTRTGRQTA